LVALATKFYWIRNLNSITSISG